VGINRFSDIEERKRGEKAAKASDEIPGGKKGDTSSRLGASEEPAEDSGEARGLRETKGTRTRLLLVREAPAILPDKLGRRRLSVPGNKVRRVVNDKRLSRYSTVMSPRW
jgi:hypothetical protein